MKITIDFTNVSSWDITILKEYLEGNKWDYSNKKEQYNKKEWRLQSFIEITWKIDTYDEVPNYELDELVWYLKNNYWKYSIVN